MARFEDLLDRFFYRPDEDVGDVVELSAPPIDRVEKVAEEQAEKYLSFALAGETYALPISGVREIVKVPHLTEVPRAGQNLLGVMNLRGEVIPVYDLKLRLRLSDERANVAGPDARVDLLPRTSRVLVLNSDDGPWGILADSVSDVVRLRPSQVETPPPGLARGEREWVLGIGREREQLYILLDVQQALA